MKIEDAPTFAESLPGVVIGSHWRNKTWMIDGTMVTPRC